MDRLPHTGPIMYLIIGVLWLGLEAAVKFAPQTFPELEGALCVGDVVFLLLQFGVIVGELVEQNGDGSQLGICQIHCKMRDDVHEKDLRNFEQFTNYDIQINDNGKYESYRMKTHFIPLLTLPSGQNNLEIRKLLIESEIGMEETDIQRFIWPERKKGIFILYFSTDCLYMHGVGILPGDVGLRGFLYSPDLTIIFILIIIYECL